MAPPPPSPLVSVLMPTFRQASFLPRAVESLLAQSWPDWELIVVDDGSPDETGQVVGPYLADPRITYHRLTRNVGLGAALNHATGLARGRYLAYLPSDDLYYPDHLERLVGVLEGDPGVDLAYGGVRWEYGHSGPTLRGEAAVGREADFIGLPPESKAEPTSGNLLALVQVMHRRGGKRWTERSERVSDTLEADFWRTLLEGGARFAYTGAVTCEWVSHPDQRHRIIAGVPGGLSRYRAHYGVGRGEFLNFQPSRGMRVNEAERYGRFAGLQPPTRPDRLHILLVGSLGFNPERILALEERGHQLSGRWLPDPETWDATGPFPYGRIGNVPLDDHWAERVRAQRPDLIYALLNWQALPLIERVLDARLGIPLVFHFKEGPFICHEQGLWPALVRVLKESDGQVFISPENREWFRLALGGRLDEARTLILDGDLPKIDWMTEDWAPKLSHSDGQTHTVCAGRPLGLEPLSDLARHGIHVHFYGTHFQEWFPNWTRTGLESGFLHLHPTVEPGDWVRELSRYDAAWVQQFTSHNGGDLRRAHWDDLNLPARLGTYAAAGLPWIMRDNRHSLVAMQTLAQGHGFGIFYRDFADLAAQLRDRTRLETLTANARAARPHFAFDTHADRLLNFFQGVVERARREPQPR